jgi:beta-mannosidase
VVVDPVPASEPQVGRTEDVRVHVPRLNQGWDFSPRLPHQGLWRPVRLVVGRLQVHDVVVATEVSDLLGLVHVDAVVDGEPVAGDHLLCTVRDPHGTVVAEARVELRVGAVGATLEVPAPLLWWPNRHGDQPLYTVDLHLPGGGSAAWSGRTGFRSVRMLPNPGAPAGALPYTAEVNGTVVPLVGWNWAPADALHGEVTADRVRHLVGLAAASGARLLRVWGGGLLETPDFYDACDELGLLVWQEFSQSSSGFQSAPATDEEFLALMRAEAEVVVPPRRRHPSLLMWGGGNELDVGGVPADETTSPVLAVLRDAVTRLDPGRHWTPTSPTGPAFHNRLDVIAADPDSQHDVHGPWEHQGLEAHYRLYNAGVSLAHTEFGVEGMANARCFDGVVPEDARWPCDRSNPVMRHLGEWWNNEPAVQEAFGHRLADVPTMRRASQLLQATGLQYAVEADRRRWPRCSTVIPWQLAESFPNAWCTAVVDHLGEAKPAFHAVARAFADDRVTLRVDRAVWPDRSPAAEVWLWSVGGVAAGSRLRLRLLDDRGRPLDCWEWDDLPQVSLPVPCGTGATRPLPCDPGEVLVWEAVWTAADGTVVDRAVETLTVGTDWSGLLDLDPARVRTTVRAAGDGAAVVDVVHVSGPVVVGLHLADARPLGAPGWVRCAGDPGPLLPEERRSFAVSWTAGAAPCLRLEGFNIPDHTLDLDRSSP